MAEENINEKVPEVREYEWLKPDRVMKLYHGSKSPFGTKRLMIIGVGKNGVDCLIRAKHIAENHYQHDKSNIRFLGIGLDELVNGAEFCGSVLDGDEKLPIDPDTAIYDYLNHPEKLSEYQQQWFDEGLKNYTPNKPVYGLQKRQCGRLALFHNFAEAMKRFGGAMNAFSHDKRPLEIAIVGNMGDAFFGGMLIDLGYILAVLFETAKYPVSIAAYMFAGDTAAFTEKEGRDLATAYANTIITKNELDMYQTRRKRFWQQYNNAIEISSDKPPFTACYIAEAAGSYEETLERAALKIMRETDHIFRENDNAEKMMSYNMLDREGSHVFRCLAYTSAVNEVPYGKIVSYISLKILGQYVNELRQKSIGQQELGRLTGKVTPNAMLLATKGGEIPKFEFDLNLNPLFSLRSLKNGCEASKRYINERLNVIVNNCRNGAKIFNADLTEQIIKICENAVRDREKGPYYALEIIKACVAKLTDAAKSIRSQMTNVDDDVRRVDKLIVQQQKKIKMTPGFMASSLIPDYVDLIKEYMKYRHLQMTGGIVADFYADMAKDLMKYSDESLKTRSYVFDEITEHVDDILYGGSPYLGSGVKEAFDPLDPENTGLRDILDGLVASIPADRLELAFRRADLLGAAQNGVKEFICELLAAVDICVGEFTEKGYDEICDYFRIENSLAQGIEDCFNRANITTPVTSGGTQLTRVICPSTAKPAEIAPLHAAHKELNDIWNASSSAAAVSIVRIQGAVKLEKFKDYDQWENMCYAYVNDSLKKHGMCIFKNS